LHALAWSSDGEWLAAGAASGEITLWNARTGDFIRRFDGHRGIVRGLAFDSPRSLLASSSDDGTVRLWELTSERPSLNFSVQTYGLTFSRDGRQVGPVWAFGPTGVLALERPAGFLSLRPQPPVESRFSIAWSPDGRWVAAASGAGVRVWNASSHRMLPSEPIPIESVAFDPQDGTLAGGSEAGVRRYALPNTDLEPLRLTDGLPEHTYSPGVCFSQDGERFAVARDVRGTIDVFLRGKKTPEVSLGNEMQFSAVALSADGELVAGSAEWGADRVRVWKTTDGSRAAELKTEGAQRSAFSPDGEWLATFGAHPQLWNTSTWKSGPSIDFGLRNELAGAGAFSRDGKLLVVLLGAGIPHLLALQPNRDPELLAVLESQVAPRLRATAFSPDARYLAGVGPSGHVELWDLHALRAQLRERALDWSF
jgi:WD40 repeat protein